MIGLLLACSIIIATNGFKQKNYKQLCAYVGIVPYKHESGTSVFRRARSRVYGHKLLKKLLCLASLSVSRHDQVFRRYYVRKVAEGKPKRVVLNNISNKLLKLSCALIKYNMLYIENYKSINPVLVA